MDELGRIVLPSELRKRVVIHPGDGREIFLDGDRLVLRPYRPSCVFCGKVGHEEPLWWSLIRSLRYSGLLRRIVNYHGNC